MKRAHQRPPRARPDSREPPLRIALLAFDDAQILDITGPLEVFGRASRWLREERGATGERYVLELLSAHGPVLRSSSGLRLVADGVLPRAGRGATFDTLLIAGGRGVHQVAEDARVLTWVRNQAPRVRRLASVCTGAFVLAAAGLLDGRRAVTHWSECDRLAKLHPAVRVEQDPIYLRDGHVYTSAGVTAGMDLALALVEEDCGRDIAMAVARELVLFLRRPGGQSQFSAQLSAQTAEREPLRDLQAWMVDHPGDDLRIPALARRVAMSERHFRRAFTAEVGLPPARFAEQVRVEAARRALEETSDGVDAIAARLGFGTSESMRRAFNRVLRTSPTTYRERFRAAQPRRHPE
ncbi:GlxA family transcriptional regulator [Pyxidicoccus fallax]|uniref:GlxA family transcriptional regulator n=1 Tax=Pyxidicoccus fallax TaxID=394095 RepID=A0A848LYG9_9BACT|nr:GlxA family transcriptional regulator [Pyxidicoccus fallax]NMO22876.1 GlxA family transcriptional regulator [Pyxidicoccus fallax]NPC86312.1 GlxA family transcriptional regulator [Pyxidicoccus fallax]